MTDNVSGRIQLKQQPLHCFDLQFFTKINLKRLGTIYFVDQPRPLNKNIWSFFVFKLKQKLTNLS